ncbi:MAG: hypothetical protein L7F78_24165, partial [Syntrophales bacterium LBB04]|nr:hypothetical protein [Syntrophales bacterium LBB04]
MNRSFIDALEADDFDVFNRRSECARLVRQYTDYLKLNQMEALRLFSAQWKLTGGVKRYPKLTQFADADVSPVKSAMFKGKRRLISHLPTKGIWLSVVAVALVAMSVLVIDLLDTRWKITPADYLPPSEPEIKVLPVKKRVPFPATDAEGRIASTNKVSVPEVPHSPTGVAERKNPPHPKGAVVIGNRDSERYHLP